MIYSIEYQKQNDIDWFGISEDFGILYFASGGGPIPDSISSSPEGNQLVYEYFRQLNDCSESILKRPEIVSRFDNQAQEDRYFEDFVFMARKGVYSFDKNNLGDFKNNSYHLVASPEELLKFDNLPENIRLILNRTMIKGKIKELTSISLQDVSVTEI